MTEILIIAGEASGDIYGANLTKAIKAANPAVRVTAVGGGRMRQAGAEILSDPTQFATVGVTEVAENFHNIGRIFRRLMAHIYTNRPSCIVFIDYPEFNLKFAAYAKQLGIPMAYFVTPQIWAWRQGRVKLFERYIDLNIVAFEFEKEFFAKHGVKAEFVGHPILDVIGPVSLEEKRNHPMRKEFGVGPDDKLFALLPGSRLQEFKRHFPVMTETARALQKQLPGSVFLLACAPNITKKHFEQLYASSNAPFTPVHMRTYDALRAADMAIVASGTATLETAVIGTPMVVIYKLALSTYLMAKLILSIKHISTVNIVAGRTVVPELIQGAANPERIAASVMEMLGTENWHAVYSALGGVRDKLGAPGATARAAKLILDLIGAKSNA